MRDALAALIGEKNVRSDAEARTGASSGWHPASAKQRQSSDGGAAAAHLPALVVSPGDASEVAAVVRWANETRTPLIPVGGASNTTGSTVPEPAAAAVAVRLDRLQSLDWDEESLVVRAGAGWNLGALEERLNAHGYTLGHAPQSLHLATVGGCVATNAVGVLSGKYGRQSDLTLAVEAVLPNGEIVRLGGTAGGPDLLGLLIGSEGTLGIVTEATLRMSPLPDVRAWAAFTFERFGDGLDALRLIYRTDARPAVARLLDAAAAAELSERGGAAAPPLLLLAFEGDELVQTGQYQMAHAVCQKVGGAEIDPGVGEAWFERDRLHTGWMAPNGRAGGLADVFAVWAPWARLAAVYEAMTEAVAPLVTALHGQVGHAGPTGAALDLVFEAQAEPATPEAALGLYDRIVRAGLDACRARGGSVAHHYGVGVSRREAWARELGENDALPLLRRLKAALDPHNVLNPGKLAGRTEEP